MKTDREFFEPYVAMGEKAAANIHAYARMSRLEPWVRVNMSGGSMKLDPVLSEPEIYGCIAGWISEEA